MDEPYRVGQRRSQRHRGPQSHDFQAEGLRAESENRVPLSLGVEDSPHLPGLALYKKWHLFILDQLAGSP